MTVDAYDSRLGTYFATEGNLLIYGTKRKNEQADLEK